MKTNRRGFLGMLGIGAVAGPSITKEVDMQRAMNVPFGSFGNPAPEPAEMSWAAAKTPVDRVVWAKDALKGILGKTKAQMDRERINTTVYQYEANVASLRSVSMTARIRMSRDAHFNRNLRKEKDHLEGIIYGWW